MMSQPSVQLLFGPMLIGVFLNNILFGVLIAQAFVYYRTYTTERAWIRYLVLYLVILETCNTAFDMAMMFQPLIHEYGMPSAVTKTPTLLAADGITIVLISTPVQLFIAWRIKIITSSIVMPSVIGFFSFCSFVGGMATTICVSLIPEYARLHKFEGAVITWLASSAIADVIIAVTLVISLRKRRTGVTSTNDILNRIIRLTIQTGAVTAIFAILDVTMFLGKGNTTFNFLWDLPLGKLYTNSLLSTLNARAGWSQVTAGQQQDNVLFGPSPAPPKGAHRTTGSHTNWDAIHYRKPIEPRSTGHVINTDCMKSDHDLELGVVITKTTEQKSDSVVFKAL